MSLKAFFKETRTTTEFLFKTCAVVFSLIFILIALLTEYGKLNFPNSILYLFICLLLGVLLAGIIGLVAVLSAFGKVKSTFRFYDTIPNEIKSKYGLQLWPKRLDSKLNYLQYDILDTKSKRPIRLDYDTKNVWIKLHSSLKSVKDFPKRTFEIQKKYKREAIILTGWGLGKRIKRSNWNEITADGLKAIIDELKLISSEEKLT